MNHNMKKWGKIDLFLVLLAAIPIVVSFIMYDKLPDRLAVHFGVTGHPNRYQEKVSFLILSSLVILGLPILLKVLSFIDPKRENYEKFRTAFDLFRVILTLFLSAIFGFTLAYNLGYPINAQKFVLIGIGVMFVVFGNYMGQIRFNYFIGIRTPWTLANETVWSRTHRFAGPIWALMGLIAILCAFLPGNVAVWVFGAILAIGSISPIVYSFILYRRLQKE
jgi:uncharacterized membrane protein